MTMTTQYTSDSQHEANSFVMGLMTGAILGAGLAMLFAPKKGSELRSQLSDTANTVAGNASKAYRRASETAGQWVERGREAGEHAFRKTRQAVNEGTEEAQRYVREASERDPYASELRVAEPASFSDTSRESRRDH
jgi:gas vesicle protein